mmetsp:Transcript_47398/g.113757  ORF Transcript_47398/g.113757 Transcript_47398/m.113757 type:complete len:202 (-) Transcript_47398:328-933(-)
MFGPLRGKVVHDIFGHGIRHLRRKLMKPIMHRFSGELVAHPRHRVADRLAQDRGESELAASRLEIPGHGPEHVLLHVRVIEAGHEVVVVNYDARLVRLELLDHVGLPLMRRVPGLPAHLVVVTFLVFTQVELPHIGIRPAMLACPLLQERCQVGAPCLGNVQEPKHAALHLRRVVVGEPAPIFARRLVVLERSLLVSVIRE